MTAMVGGGGMSPTKKTETRSSDHGSCFAQRTGFIEIINDFWPSSRNLKMGTRLTLGRYSEGANLEYMAQLPLLLPQHPLILKWRTANRSLCEAWPCLYSSTNLYPFQQTHHVSKQSMIKDVLTSFQSKRRLIRFSNVERDRFSTKLSPSWILEDDPFRAM